MEQRTKIRELLGWGALVIGLIAMGGPAQVFAWLVFAGFILYILLSIWLFLRML